MRSNLGPPRLGKGRGSGGALVRSAERVGRQPNDPKDQRDGMELYHRKESLMLMSQTYLRASVLVLAVRGVIAQIVE